MASDHLHNPALQGEAVGRRGAASAHCDGLSFRLDSFLLFVALVCTWLAALRVSFEFGCVLIALLAPALVRTAMIARHFERRGSRLKVPQRLIWFCSSVAAMCLVYFGGSLAMAGTWLVCTLLGRVFGEDMAVVGAVVGLMLGLATGILVSVQVAVRLWPFAEERPAENPALEGAEN